MVTRVVGRLSRWRGSTLVWRGTLRGTPTGEACVRCSKPLRYGDRTVTLRNGSLVHAVCDEG